MNVLSILNLVVYLPILVFSVILHEVFHGLAAQKFGDDTAYISGRLTLNPLPHLDLVGSFIFPAICILTSMPVFGWAKPVPINPNRFTKYKEGVILVSLAGPFANLLIAGTCALILRSALQTSFQTDGIPLLAQFLPHAILLNLVLAVFNLFPVPPLDGSRILSVLLPQQLSSLYDSLEPYGFIIVMALVATGILGGVMSPIVYALYSAMLGR